MQKKREKEKESERERKRERERREGELTRNYPLIFVILQICNRHFTIITIYCRCRATIHNILSSNVPSVWKQTGF